MAQEARGAERIEFQDVVGGAFVARLVKDRAGEIDIEEEDLSGSVHAEIEAGVAFAFEADEDLGGGPPEALVQCGIGHWDVALGVVLRDLQFVGLEAGARREENSIGWRTSG